MRYLGIFQIFLKGDNRFRSAIWDDRRIFIFKRIINFDLLILLSGSGYKSFITVVRLFLSFSTSLTLVFKSNFMNDILTLLRSRSCSFVFFKFWISFWRATMKRSFVSFDFPNLSEYISVDRDSIFLFVSSTNWSNLHLKFFSSKVICPAHGHINHGLWIAWEKKLTSLFNLNY